jgi:hypothetical protein
MRAFWPVCCDYRGEGLKETDSMQRIRIAIATVVMMTAGAVLTYADITPPQPQPGSGQQQGKRNGKKLGKQDGSGPQHTPGTGGGTGAAQRRGGGGRR